MTELAKLRWQCRRGCKELDLLLTDYLDNRYPQADDKEKALFKQMLTWEDAQLLHFFEVSQLPGPQSSRRVN